MRSRGRPAAADARTMPAARISRRVATADRTRALAGDALLLSAERGDDTLDGGPAP